MSNHKANQCALDAEDKRLKETSVNFSKITLKKTILKKSFVLAGKKILKAYILVG